MADRPFERRNGGMAARTFERDLLSMVMIRECVFPRFRQDVRKIGRCRFALLRTVLTLLDVEKALLAIKLAIIGEDDIK